MSRYFTNNHRNPYGALKKVVFVGKQHTAGVRNRRLGVSTSSSYAGVRNRRMGVSTSSSYGSNGGDSDSNLNRNPIVLFDRESGRSYFLPNWSSSSSSKTLKYKKVFRVGVSSSSSSNRWNPVLKFLRSNERRRRDIIEDQVVSTSDISGDEEEEEDDVEVRGEVDSGKETSDTASTQNTATTASITSLHLRRIPSIFETTIKSLSSDKVKPIQQLSCNYCLLRALVAKFFFAAGKNRSNINKEQETLPSSTTTSPPNNYLKPSDKSELESTPTLISDNSNRILGTSSSNLVVTGNPISEKATVSSNLLITGNPICLHWEQHGLNVGGSGNTNLNYVSTSLQYIRRSPNLKEDDINILEDEEVDTKADTINDIVSSTQEFSGFPLRFNGLYDGKLVGEYSDLLVPADSNIESSTVSATADSIGNTTSSSNSNLKNFLEGLNNKVNYRTLNAMRNRYFQWSETTWMVKLIIDEVIIDDSLQLLNKDDEEHFSSCCIPGSFSLTTSEYDVKQSEKRRLLDPSWPLLWFRIFRIFRKCAICGGCGAV